MEQKITPFLIMFTKLVRFKDREGTVVKVFQVGDTCEATSENGHFFVTTMGGIWHDEAVRVKK
jgi:hypothetical protein